MTDKKPTKDTKDTKDTEDQVGAFTSGNGKQRPKEQ